MTEGERNIALHESGHAAMGLTLHLPVSSVRRWTPDPRVDLGATYFNNDLTADMDKDRARRIALMVLAGPGMADLPLPEWPLQWHRSKDEKLLEVITRCLEMDEVDYLGLQTEMWQLSTTKRFDRFFRVLMAWFEHRRTLDEYVLTWAKAMVMTWPEAK